MPHMNGKRTDMSFTLFLSDPETYEGGELMMKELGSSIRVKPKAGQLVIYPTGVLHQVSPVTKGERLAVVGWIESFVPDDDARASLYNFSRIMIKMRSLIDTNGKVDQKTFDFMNQTYLQLIRKLSR